MFVWKKQNNEEYNSGMIGLKSTESGGDEKRGEGKHLRMKERKKMSLSIVRFLNPDMKAELWEVIASTRGRSTHYTTTTMSTLHN